MTKIEASLSLNKPWAIGESKYRKILLALSGRKVKYIIEFGSGRSTVRLSLDFPNANIISVEHHDIYHKETLELLRNYHVKNAVVLHCPLKLIRIGFRYYLTFDLKTIPLESKVDFILIDGPVESETIRGREAPLYMTFPLLKIGGLVALDDYHRDSAKIVVENWLNSYKENLRILKKYKKEGLVLLQKCGEQKQLLWPGVRSMQDNLYANLRLSIRNFKRLILSVISR